MYYSTLKIVLLLTICVFNVKSDNNWGEHNYHNNNNDYNDHNNNNNNYNNDNNVDYLTQTASNTYDYIVVGVGQAGSVAAARLAAHYRVLGIEGGGPSQRDIGGRDYVASDLTTKSDGYLKVHQPWTRWDVPHFAPTIYYPPTPYPDYLMYENGFLGDSFVCRILGGAGVHNGMVYLRFTKETINSWNISGWSYDQVLPFYKKSENVTGSRVAVNTAYHGYTGPIQLSDSPQNQYYSAVPVWFQACNATGYPYNPDYNGPTRLGCGTQNWNIRRGVRDSSAVAFLPPAVKSGNLTLSLYSQASKILIKPGTAANGYKPIAYGVEYIKHGITRRAYANKEVVVTASAIFTPVLLLLSGIGNATTLNELGIHVWVNNTNVGVGLQSNHFGQGLYSFPGAIYPNGMDSGIATEYGLYGTGPWAWTNQFGDGYFCSNGTNCSNPDVYIGTAMGNFTLLMTVSTATPLVKGIVTISTTDPFAPPNVTINHYEYQADLDAMVAGYKLMRKLMATPVAHAQFPVELIPGPTVVTDAQIANYVKLNTAAAAHWVGTARIGNPGDKTAVCDTQMRVLGIDGLRVGDASVFPSTNTHTQASATMAGERVASFILYGV